MPRARNIKPGFFKNEDLAELSMATRLLFIGLWTLADREGRMEDRPMRIKIEIFPCDEVDIGQMICDLCERNFLQRYESDGKRYIEVVNFVKHQDPHYREKASEIPPPPGSENRIIAANVTRTQRARILERCEFKCINCQSNKHLCIDHVIPVSRGGSSEDENLQVLCLTCNRVKGNKVEQCWPNDDSTTAQRRLNVEPTKVLDVPLIPDSLIPDSLIPEEELCAAKAPPPAEIPVVREVLESAALLGAVVSSPHISTEAKAPIDISKANPRGTRFKLDAIPEDWLAWPIQHLGWDQNRTLAVYAKFGDHFRAKTGQAATKLDWFATWRNWCRDERQSRDSRANSPPLFPDKNQKRRDETLALTEFLMERPNESAKPL